MNLTQCSKTKLFGFLFATLISGCGTLPSEPYKAASELVSDKSRLLVWLYYVPYKDQIRPGSNRGSGVAEVKVKDKSIGMLSSGQHALLALKPDTRELVISGNKVFSVVMPLDPVVSVYLRKTDNTKVQTVEFWIRESHGAGALTYDGNKFGYLGGGTSPQILHKIEPKLTSNVERSERAFLFVE